MGKKSIKGKNGKNNNGNKSKGAKNLRKGEGRAKFSKNVFNEEVIENAYCTYHNIMAHCNMKYRGFPCPNQKKEKKGRK